MFARPVHAPDVGTAWLDALRAVHATPDHWALHTHVGIDNPTAEDPDLRFQADRILKEYGLPSIETVANTIFPAALANLCASHDELVARYREIYPVLRTRWHRQNREGTYFGRLVDHPIGDDPGGYDQLGVVIGKLRAEHAHSGAKTAIYEASLGAVGDEEPPVGGAAATAAIFSPGHDKLPVGGFPCLSHCSFQLDREGRVHLLAQYRSQYLIQRGYGNYLGLGRLLAHVCRHTGLRQGRLTVTAGYAQIEVRRSRKITALLAQPNTLF
jgi:hypothetical protein